MRAELGFGMGRYDWKGKELAIHSAFENGVRFFDTAESYNSERILSDNKFNGKVTISTKFSPSRTTQKDITEAAEGSLKNLCAESIDIYSPHWLNYGVEIAEIYSALVRLKESGKIKNIGFCNVSMNDLKVILSLGKIDYVQNEYNVFDRWSEDTFEYCTQHDIKCVCYSPLDQGICCDLHDGSETIKSIAEKHSSTPFQVVLSWICSRGIIPLFTSKNIEHTIENAESNRVRLEDDEIQSINKMGAKKEHISVKEITPLDGGHYDRIICKTLEDAISNTADYCPSPLCLAEYLLKGNDMKPIKICAHKNGGYKLIEGRCRFWAWVIAFGPDSKIPAFIRETVI